MVSDERPSIEAEVEAIVENKLCDCSRRSPPNNPAHPHFRHCLYNQLSARGAAGHAAREVARLVATRMRETCAASACFSCHQELPGQMHHGTRRVEYDPTYAPGASAYVHRWVKDGLVFGICDASAIHALAVPFGDKT